MANQVTLRGNVPVEPLISGKMNPESKANSVAAVERDPIVRKIVDQPSAQKGSVSLEDQNSPQKTGGGGPPIRRAPALLLSAPCVPRVRRIGPLCHLPTRINPLHGCSASENFL